MNPDTGHLKALDEETAKSLEEGYEKVPEELNRAARRKLNGRSDAHVSLTSGGKLSKWAAQKRKNRNKMAKQSRKANRA